MSDTFGFVWRSASGKYHRPVMEVHGWSVRCGANARDMEQVASNATSSTVLRCRKCWRPS